MQSGQTSLSVPIITGVFTIAGVIAGSIINAWLEGRRSKRETEHEELRWKRDLEKDSIARTLENVHYWRERKFNAYSELFLALTTCGDAIRKGLEQLDKGREIDRHSRDRIIEYLEMYEKYFATVILFTTQDRTKVTMIESLEQIHGFASQMKRGSCPQSRKSDDIADLVGCAIDDFNGAIRAELQIGLGDPARVNR